MNESEDIFEAISNFMKGKAGSFNSDIAKLSVEGEVPSDALVRPILSSTFSEFSGEYSLVIKGISSCSLEHCLEILGSMLTIPELQCNHYRLSVLVHLAFMHAKGKKRPTTAQITAWFNQLDNGTCGRQEDPAEEVFISRVIYGSNSFRLFEGHAEGNAFHTQLFLNILNDMPGGGIRNYLKSSIIQLLKLSEAIAIRAELPANNVGNVSPVGHIQKPMGKIWRDLKKRVTFTKEDLDEDDIHLDLLEPFLSRKEEIGTLANYNPDCSPLGLKVLFEKPNGIIVHSPNLIGIAIRTFFIQTCQQLGILDQVQEALANAYASLFMNEGFIDVNPPPIQYETKGGYYISQASIALDPGKYLHLLFFVDGFDNVEKGGFSGINNIDEISSIVDVAIQHAHKTTSSKNGFREGLTLIVGCGWGRVLGLGFKELPDNWRAEMLPAHDAITLTNLPNFDLLDLLKTLDAKEAIERAGIHLNYTNGFLNLVAWIRNNDGHIVPHEKLDDEIVSDSESLLTLPINSNLDARLEALQAADTQIVLKPDGLPTKIRRVHGTPQFGSSELSPFYVDMSVIQEQIYRSVYLGHGSSYWIEATTDITAPINLRFNLCNMIMRWGEKVFEFFESNIGFVDQSYISLKYHFDDVVEPNGNDPVPDQLALEGMITHVSDKGVDIISTVIGRQFLTGTRRTDNFAERLIVKSIIENCAKALKVDLSQSQVNETIDAIVKNEQARHVHGFAVPKTRDFIQDNLPKPIIIERVDDANSRLGLGWLCRDRSEGNYIEGIGNCKQYLKDLVQALIHQVKASVSTYDRHELIKKLVLNHEALYSDLDTWMRTYGSLEALSDDSSLAASSIADKIGSINAACMSCRIICEVAICEGSSENGVQPGDYDIQTLMAHASTLHHLGGYSDAINSELMPAEIKISPGGDVLMNHGFTDNIVRPFGKTFQTASLRNAAKKYSENYMLAPQKVSDDLNDENQSSDEKMFEEAWLNEFGFTFDDFRLIIGRFYDLLKSECQAIMFMPVSDLKKYLSQNTQLSPETLNAFIKAFSLQPRQRWDEASEGMLNSSWQPWRFLRQLSLVTRPIIIFDDIEEAECIIAPAMVVENLIKFATDARTGAFDQKFFRDKEPMFKWIGMINGREGEAFNEVVAENFRNLGWKAISNQSDGQLLNRKKDPLFGDVDVFAWNEDTKRVLVIECKDLSFDKTIGEISKRLKNYRGVKKNNGKRDDLLKHIDRCDQLEKALNKLEKTTGFAVEGIERVLLFSQSTPMQFSDITEKFSIKILTLDEIDAEFGS